MDHVKVGGGAGMLVLSTDMEIEAAGTYVKA